MKKVFLSTLILLGFSLSMLIFQASCKKEATAQQNTQTITGTILYSLYNDNTSTTEYWICNEDGSNNKKIPLILPSGLRLDDPNGKLSKDGKTLIFVVRDTSNKRFIYSCSLDGGNLKKLIDGSSNTGNGITFEILGVS
ncbi:hypothetical protein PBAC_05000 [Pedobacter glucosidilyticus]|nr:hypothetical protein [Pedobacter glucosidilyticus]KHJ39187.1 hypothetical protein PBAC_05000 [Pedobacter glucosidilyticus]